LHVGAWHLMRLVFAGTPRTAVPALDALLASRHEVVAVVTRPGAPAGRGRRVETSPVARRAAEAGLEVLTPARARDPEFLDRLREIAPDCCPVTAYGALLPQAALDIPPNGWVNLHFSILPAWRGAAPVQHAILHGDDVTGASTFQIVKELDAGPVYGVLTEPVRPDDTTGTLLDRLSHSGAELLVATLDGIEDGTVQAVPQPAEGVSFALKITPADARVDWKLPAHVIDRLIRACTPDPGAWTELGDARLKLGPVSLDVPGAPGSPGPPGSPGGAAPAAPLDLAPGELYVGRHEVLVGTGSRLVRLGDVQAPGKRRMTASDWARGLHSGGPVRFS
jgi:methionyl-tRNA formyltransferase